MEFRFGEVVPYPDTYKEENSLNLYTILVQPYGNDTYNPIPCMPASNNNINIPVPGEHVIIYKAINQYTNADDKFDQWYYFQPYPIQSDINNNILPSIAQPVTSDINQPFDVQENAVGFTDTKISPLQPYEGDILTQGRWGNSIRVGSTVNTNVNLYSKSPTWSGNKNGDPIIILSNQRNNAFEKNFVVENIKNDGASLYLTSTQKINELKLSKNLKTQSNKENRYSSPQLIGSADRIILSAKRDIIALDSDKRIALITSELNLGSDEAKHPIVKGDTLEDILRHIINAIKQGTSGSPFFHTANGLAELTQAEELLIEMNSKTVNTI